MIQTILTFIILVITFGYVIYKLIKTILKFNNNKSACSGCAGKSCEGCPFNGGLDIQKFGSDIK